MIKISVPNDDHVALRAMAKALEDIAVARGAPAQSVDVTMEKIDFNELIPNFVGHRSNNAADVDTTSQQVESLNVKQDLSTGDTELPSVASSTPHPADTTDSTGTPWDERIHSASKALNGDGTWRLRRKPKHMDDEQWVKYIEAVKTDTTAAEDDSWETDRRPDELDEALEEYDELVNVTPEGDDFHTDVGVVTEQHVASFPPPPPVPVPSVQAALEKGMERYGDAMSKLAENDGAPSLTFPQVMAFLTERHGGITSAQVDQIIADMGLEKITDLNTQPEHTGPFIARVKALLGE